MKEKLEIGVLIDDPTISAWELSIIEELTLSDYARIALIFVDKNSESYLKQRNEQVSIVFKLHQKLDNLIFQRKNSYAKKRNLLNSFPDVPVIEFISTTDEGLKYFNIDDLSIIKKFNLDIIIKLSYGLIGGEILKLPTYGVWSYSWKIFNSGEEDTAGYYEIPSRNPITAAALMILKDQKEDQPIIAGTVESTCAYSISLNRNKLFSRSAFFLPRVARGIYDNGPDYLEKLIDRQDQHISEISNPIAVPSFARSLLNIWRSIIILSGKIIKKIFYTDAFSWILFFNISPDNDFMKNKYGTFARLKPSKGKFWADPFIITRGDHHYLFVEEFIYKKNKGHISVVELDRNGLILDVQRILEKPYHMSYPFIFEVESAYYMIPESGANRTVDLYKCIEFPYKWIFVKSIMRNINAVDSTLFHYNNKWWLFTVIDKLDKPNDPSPELYLFFSDNFLSETWCSHPMNPIVTDVRNARPAGKIFIKEGEIYRPSQDCAGRYGNSFDINRILVLTEIDYKEEKVIKIRPDWNNKLKGTHTFNSDGDFTVIDAYSLRRRFV